MLHIHAIVLWLVNTKLKLSCKYVSKVFIELTNNVLLQEVLYTPIANTPSRSAAQGTNIMAGTEPLNEDSSPPHPKAWVG